MHHIQSEMQAFGHSTDKAEDSFNMVGEKKGWGEKYLHPGSWVLRPSNDHVHCIFGFCDHHGILLVFNAVLCDVRGPKDLGEPLLCFGSFNHIMILCTVDDDI